MKALLAAVLCGLLFGAGLVVSDMINPARVLAFLDITGEWDASLAWVMGAALVPSSLAYVLRARMSTPLAADRFHVPPRAAVDGRLLAGAALFGLGWGLVGLCPGPALAALITLRPGHWDAGLFLSAMLAGMALFRAIHAPTPTVPRV